ncbi:MAG: SoxR reducing system RseC family protein [Muribaculaceae bacterium]|nr:SoxR reducing system RseC family protein [Muribaculaceae bacterium]
MIRHKAEVVGTDGDIVHVRIRLSADGGDCGACALSSVCSPSDSRSSFVFADVPLPPGYEPPAPGAVVTVEARAGVSLAASLSLLAAPLAIFLAVAVAGTLLDISPGLTGIAALSGAAVPFLFIYLRRHRAKAIWRIADSHSPAK